MNPLYPGVAERAGERCEYCRAPEQVFNFAFEVEHILPRASGGDNASGNLALACEACNLYKSDSTSTSRIQHPVGIRKRVAITRCFIPVWTSGMTTFTSTPERGVSKV